MEQDIDNPEDFQFISTAAGASTFTDDSFDIVITLKENVEVKATELVVDACVKVTPQTKCK